MRRIFLFASALCCIFSLNAQTVEEGLAYVKYHIKFVNDTTNRNKPYETDIYTVIGKEYSLYTQILPQKEEPEIAVGNTRMRVTRSVSFSSGTPLIVEPFVYKFSTNELIAAGRFGGEFTAIVDPRPSKWNITDEKKEIGGYEAKKATISWKGRDYEVWFTEELPFATGPWKFTGLPGLVLEVKDKSGEILITYEGFDKFDEPRPINIFYGTPKKVSYEEFISTRTKFQDNAGAYLENMTAGGSAKMIIKNQDGQELSMDEMKAMMKKSAEEGKKRNNNPVEF